MNEEMPQIEHEQEKETKEHEHGKISHEESPEERSEREYQGLIMCMYHLAAVNALWYPSSHGRERAYGRTHNTAYAG